MLLNTIIGFCFRHLLLIFGCIKSKRAMNKRLIKFVVFTITILTANLLSDYAGDFLTSYKYQYKPLTFTLIAMGVITLIFYPLFEFLEKWVGIFSKRIVREGKNFVGPNLGLLLVFLISMTVLTFLYVKQWYGINIFIYLKNSYFPNLL